MVLFTSEQSIPRQASCMAYVPFASIYMEGRIIFEVGLRCWVPYLCLSTFAFASPICACKPSRKLHSACQSRPLYRNRTNIEYYLGCKFLSSSPSQKYDRKASSLLAMSELGRAPKAWPYSVCYEDPQDFCTVLACPSSYLNLNSRLLLRIVSM